MTSRQKACLTAAALAVTPVLWATPAHADTIVVHPGESVQAAVDAARPGDVIELEAGEYPGAVQISTDRLTLRGQGAATVIRPGAVPPGGCAQAGHGVCLLGYYGHPVAGVHVESLTIAGFPKNGLNASGTTGLTVRNVLARDNGQQGISQEMSTGAVVEDNEARGNGQAGIFVANFAYREGGALDTRGTVISGNRLSDNRYGVVLRRVRSLSVESNFIKGNCGGVFVIGDENVPRAGALSVASNLVKENNKFCPRTARLDAVQGAGIVLTGTEDTRVTDNQVTGNVGATSFSGGIVLYRSIVGAPNTGAVVSDNLAVDNGPADLANRDTGADNVFEDNLCHVSEPAGLC